VTLSVIMELLKQHDSEQRATPADAIIADPDPASHPDAITSLDVRDATEPRSALSCVVIGV
jgi:hypothetical protein